MIQFSDTKSRESPLLHSQLLYISLFELPNSTHNMTLQMAPLLAFTIVSLISITIHAETREHGLNNQNPVALSPQAFEFFHPKSLQPNAAAGPSLPLAASVESTPAHESVATHEKKHIGAGAIAAIPLGFVFVGLIAMGAYYVVSKRRANLRRASAEQPLQA